MSKKRTTYSAEFKAKTVLEILEGENTLAIFKYIINFFI